MKVDIFCYFVFAPLVSAEGENPNCKGRNNTYVIKMVKHQFCLGQKKIYVLFPETSKYFYGSVGRQKKFYRNNFLYRKSMKIIQN